MVLHREKPSAFLLALSVVLQVGVSQASAQDRANPLPLPGNEIKGALRPGVRTETWYAMEASGDLDFTLSVTGYQDWTMVEVEVLDAAYLPLLKLEASASTPNGSDKREAKLHLGDKQVVLLRVGGPSANKSGSFGLRLGGKVSGVRRGAAPPNQDVVQKPTVEAPIENRSDSRNLQESKKSESGGPVSPAVAVPSGIREIGVDHRLALLIGNSAYDASPLKNPVNDARAMAEALAACGFRVTKLENANKRSMEEAIRAFGAQLNATSAGLFYFAGHGLQVNGTNYLVPLGVHIEKEADVEFETVDVGRVLAEFANSHNVLSIVILDACRDNPFTAATRSLTRGLAVVRLPKDENGTLIAYATSPGNVARDGTGENGLYTEELLRHLRTPGLKIEEVFKLTRIGVKERSKGAQVPWENSSIDGDFVFVRQQTK
jgi:hypothetical protein